MAKFVKAYPGALILPNGEEVGSEIDLSKEALENAGIKEWLENGWLVKPGQVVKASAEDSSQVKADLSAAQDAVARLTADLADRDAKIAELTDQVAKLTADLEAATKPKE